MSLVRSTEVANDKLCLDGVKRNKGNRPLVDWEESDVAEENPRTLAKGCSCLRFIYFFAERSLHQFKNRGDPRTVGVATSYFGTSRTRLLNADCMSPNIARRAGKANFR